MPPLTRKGIVNTNVRKLLLFLNSKLGFWEEGGKWERISFYFVSAERKEITESIDYPGSLTLVSLR